MTADELFEKGIALLSDNNPLAALAFFEKAYTAKKHLPSSHFWECA